MTKTICGAPAALAERVISSVRIAMTWSSGPQIWVASALVCTLKPGWVFNRSMKDWMGGRKSPVNGYMLMSTAERIL